MSNAKYDTLLTHPGSAHKDELLACSVLLAKHPAPIVRREPTADDLTDPKIAVIDVGDLHQPECGNFDHHQFPHGTQPTCSLSLVLQHLGLYEDARTFCEWLEPAEWFDCRGAKQTAAWLGVDRSIIGKLNSPIDVSLLRRFAAASQHFPGEPTWEMLRLVGSDLIEYLVSTRERIDSITARHEIWEIQGLRFLFLPRTDPLPEDPSAGIGHFLRKTGLDATVAGLIHPDRRSIGYGLSRYDDHPSLDFTRIEQEADVHFAHKSGFVAKTTATDPVRLQELASLSVASV